MCVCVLLVLFSREREGERERESDNTRPLRNQRPVISIFERQLTDIPLLVIGIALITSQMQVG